MACVEVAGRRQEPLFDAGNRQFFCRTAVMEHTSQKKTPSGECAELKALINIGRFRVACKGMPRQTGTLSWTSLTTRMN